MEIRHDKEADAMHITFRRGEFAKNRKLDNFTNLDAKGNTIGIEILDASKRMPKKSLNEVRVKNLLAMAE